MTDAELGELLHLSAQSVTPRRGELVTLGEVVKTTGRRPTASGRSAVVWVAARFALDLAMNRATGKGVPE